MVNYKYTDHLPAMKLLCKNEKPCWNETLRRMNTPTNWLINTNLSADCRISRIIEFEITRLFKKIYYMNMSCDSASWLKIQVNSIFIEQPVLS